MSFLSLKKETFAIDISDSSIKIAKLGKKGKFFDLVSWNNVPIPKGLVVEGRITKEEELASRIKEAVFSAKGKKIKKQSAVVSLPERESFIQPLKMPKLSDEEMKTAVFFEAENYIPFSLDEVYIDFQKLLSAEGYLKNQERVLVAASPKKIVDSYISVFKKAGLTVSAMEPESLAICRALVWQEAAPYPVLIIDIEEDRSVFLIFSGHSLCFSNSIPVSGRSFTEAVAKVF